MQLLELLLQQQLASDENAVINLPCVLSLLSEEVFSSAVNVHRLWIARINTLIEHPRHHGARWAGLCLAYKTALLDRELLINSAQAWISFSLPLLSRDEAFPTSRAAINLLGVLYTRVLGMPEFHRQVITPTAQKFCTAMLQLAERPESSPRLKLLAMETLTLMVQHHPTLLVALQSRASNFTLVYLSGSFPIPPEPKMVQAAADLHACLHLTGGKVRAPLLWRKSVDAVISSISVTIKELTYHSHAQDFHTDSETLSIPPLPTDDYVVSIPLGVDRLRSLMKLLVTLLRCPTSRPVSLPLGFLKRLVVRLLGVNKAELALQDSNVSIDEQRRLLELSIFPMIWNASCDLVCALSECAQNYISPHVAEIAAWLAYHLEQPLPSAQRISFLRALESLLRNSHKDSLHASFLISRIIKALVPCLRKLLSQKPADVPVRNGDSTSSRKSGKGKKHKGYEGDELFRTSRELLLENPYSREEVLTTLNVLPFLLTSPHAGGPLVSVTSRLLVSLLLTIPQMSSAAVSQDPTALVQITQRLVSACNSTILLDPSNPWLRRGLGLMAHVIGRNDNLLQDKSAMHSLSLILHPHLPPTLRAIPQVEQIPVYVPEGKDEREAREALRLVSLNSREPSLSARVHGDPYANSTGAISSGLTEDNHTPVTNTLALSLAPSLVSSHLVTPASRATKTTPLSVFPAVAPEENPIALSPNAVVPAVDTPTDPMSSTNLFIVASLSETESKASEDKGKTATREKVVALADSDSEFDEPMPEIDMRSDSE